MSGFILSLCLLFASLTQPAAVHAAEQALDRPTLAWIQAVLDNWEKVCRRYLHVQPEPLPWIIFYDERQAWHLKPETRLLPQHKIVSSGTIRFSGRTYPLIPLAHEDGKLWVPGRNALKIDAAHPRMAAMPFADDRKTFFIALLPALFHHLGAADEARELDELFLGAVAHELTHTRHLVRALLQIKRLRARYTLPESFDDNIIQKEFEGNNEYKEAYEAERALLTSATMATDVDDCRRKLEQVLASAQKRKERFFVADKAMYGDLEDLFLAMEGIAMWVQYRTALDRAPAIEDRLTTLNRLLERADAWSQEEGLRLFLLIDRLVPRWQRRVLAGDLPSPFAVLREAIDKSAARP